VLSVIAVFEQIRNNRFDWAFGDPAGWFDLAEMPWSGAATSHSQKAPYDATHIVEGECAPSCFRRPSTGTGRNFIGLWPVCSYRFRPAWGAISLQACEREQPPQTSVCFVSVLTPAPDGKRDARV